MYFLLEFKVFWYQLNKWGQPGLEAIFSPVIFFQKKF